MKRKKKSRGRKTDTENERVYHFNMWGDTLNEEKACLSLQQHINSTNIKKEKQGVEKVLLLENFTRCF